MAIANNGRMRCRTALCFAVSGAALATTLPASADGWSGLLTVASDKVQRGVSQSDSKAAALLDLAHTTDTGWSASLGVAGPSYPSRGGEAELTPGLSRSWQLDADWLLQLGALRYQVLGSPQARTRSYGEFTLGVGWQGRVTANVSLLPAQAGYVNGQLRSGRAWAAETSVHQRLVGRLALDAGIGYYGLQAVQGTGYAYSSVGLRWGQGPLQAQLTWIASQAAARGVVPAGLAGQRWVSSVAWAF